MAKLSVPFLEQEEKKFECVVIGSGYGGSVMAARLASLFAAGQLVVLERGKEFQAGDFPENASDAAKEVKTPLNPLGLFDFSFTKDFDILRASGVGGTSLINAGVLLEPKNLQALDSAWPKNLTETELKPYFNLVRKTLAADKFRDQNEPNYIENDPELLGSEVLNENRSVKDYLNRSPEKRPSLQKVNSFGDVAKQAGLPKPKKMPVAVNFDLVSKDQTNAHGVVQNPCNLCGNCATGCNQKAKNTLNMNYLAIAKNSGAHIFSQVEVESFEPNTDGNGARFKVYIKVYSGSGLSIQCRKTFIYCNHLILAAGTMGSVPLLLRSAKSFPFSEKIGHGFSGNADTFGLSFRGDKDFQAARAADDQKTEVGPTIVSGIDLRQEKGILIQEGAIPSSLIKTLTRALSFKFFSLPKKTDLARTQIWLGMGYDRSEGQIVLNNDKISVVWKDSGSNQEIQDMQKHFQNFAKASGSSYEKSPREAFQILKAKGGVPITVHPLGGFIMAENADQGCVDEFGRVFTNTNDIVKGLYVMDGSVCRGSVGSNPSLTIAALAERAAHHFIERFKK